MRFTPCPEFRAPQSTRDKRQSVAWTKSLADCIFTSAGTSLGLQLHNHVNGSGEEIVSATVNPMDYTSADAFSRDYLCAELMSKFPDWELGINRAQVALGKFREAERKCSSANRRLIDFGANSNLTVRAQLIIQSAKRKIHRLLGPFSWKEALSNSRYGPGATATKSRRHRDAYYKVTDSRPSCTYGLVPLVHLLRSEFPWWDFELDVVRGSRVVTVPKSAKTDRTICAEPDLNVYLQLGIGRCLRSRLLRVDLLHPDRAQRENAEFAREGSLTGRLATVDLSMASDTISKELVRCLLPEDWLRALEETRSPVAILEGSSIPLEKFSAMGNGYTFELETLIFWGLCSAVIDTSPRWDRRLRVYGDDIIIDRDAVSLLSEVFDEVGFTMNPKKTFSDGPFRESCGQHYFRGDDVTPFYLRKSLSGDLDWFWAANTVRRYARLSWGLDSRWKHAYDLCLSHLSERSRRLKIPEGYSDGGLVVDFDEATPQRYVDPSTGLNAGWGGYVTHHLASGARTSRAKGYKRLYKELYLLDRGAMELHVDVPIGIEKPKVSQLYVRQWPSFGPWV